jgi:hypothetical protein
LPDPSDAQITRRSIRPTLGAALSYFRLMRDPKFPLLLFKFDPAGGLFGTLKLSEFGAVKVLGDLPSSASILSQSRKPASM